LWRSNDRGIFKISDASLWRNSASSPGQGGDDRGLGTKSRKSNPKKFIGKRLLPAGVKLLKIFASLLIASGVALLAGGAQLASLGGSMYYVAAGALFVVAGFLFWSRSRWSGIAYAALLLGTLAWALWEVGLSPWALIPRLNLAAVFGLWLMLPSMRRRSGEQGANGLRFAGAATLGCIAVIAIAFLKAPGTHASLPLPATAAAAVGDGDGDGDWRHYGNTLRGTRFSPLTQINATNVGQLEVAWTFRSGDPKDVMAAAEATPLKIGDTLFTCTTNSAVVALDAATGAELWRHVPKNPLGFYAIRACRGVAYYESPAAAGDCPAVWICAIIWAPSHCRKCT
jgi:glucose dehydrogenase